MFKLGVIMEKIEFKSQVCTTREQSERLLEMGLGKATADMVWMKELAWDEVAHCTYDADTFMLRPIDYLEGESHREHIPAWSLHRLIEMSLSLTDMPVAYCYTAGSKMGATYNEVIDMIEWAIAKGYFNKDYLEDKK